VRARRAFAATLAVGVLIVVALAGPASAAPKPGGACKRPGMTASTSNGTLVCTKVKGRLVWRRDPAPTPPATRTLLLSSLPVAATAPIGVVGGTDKGGGRSFVPFGFGANPQPVFFAPLGTAVLAPVTGKVTKVERLYSGDFTIWFGTGPEDPDVWETEHVIDPRVKVGDPVTAGQPVALVSDYDSRYTPGVGLVELGLLRTGNPPQHLCPFDHLAPGRASSIRDQISALIASDAARGIPTPAMSPIGCAGTDPIAG